MTTEVAVYIQGTCSISVAMGGLGSRGITPSSLSLSLRLIQCVLRSGIWTCSPGRSPRTFPWQPLLKLTNNNLLSEANNLGLRLG